MNPEQFMGNKHIDSGVSQPEQSSLILMEGFVNTGVHTTNLKHKDLREHFYKARETHSRITANEGVQSRNL